MGGKHLVAKLHHEVSVILLMSLNRADSHFVELCTPIPGWIPAKISVGDFAVLSDLGPIKSVSMCSALHNRSGNAPPKRLARHGHRIPFMLGEATGAPREKEALQLMEIVAAALPGDVGVCPLAARDGLEGNARAFKLEEGASEGAYCEAKE